MTTATTPTPSEGFAGPEAPSLQDILRCVHCGLCLNHCPTYLQTGLETESPRGRLYLMRGVSQGRIPITENVVRHLDLCLQCRNCEAVCPSGVRYGHLMERTRAQILRDGQRAPASWRAGRIVLRSLFSHPERLRSLMTLLRLYQRSGLEGLTRRPGLLRLLPGPWRNLVELAPRVSQRPFVARGVVGSPQDRSPKASVALLSGCMMPLFYAHVHEATVRVLVRQGLRVIVPSGQVCCGALHLHGGDREEARRLARRNIDVFLAEDVDAVVVNAAGCGAAMKGYGELLKDDPLYAEKAHRFSSLVKDVTEFLHGLPLADGLAPLNATVTYQDACHLAHAQGIKSQPRELLKSIPGLELVEMSQPDECCGSGGVYNFLHPDMSRSLLHRKMTHIAATGAQVIASANPGCMLQIETGLRRHHLSARIAHVIELLDDAYRQQAPHT
jgi:glycolate oxidase iron-sulfur subunit